MPRAIELVSGFDVQVIPSASPGVGVNSKLVSVTGFSWWVLVGVTFNINNTLGLASCAASITLQAQGVAMGTFTANAATANGATENITGGLFLPAVGVAQQGRTLGLAFLPILDEGAVVWGFLGGDANTNLGNATLTVIGRRYSNKTQ